MSREATWGCTEFNQSNAVKGKNHVGTRETGHKVTRSSKEIIYETRDYNTSDEMSSKLVRKGLELLNKDAGLKSQKRKAAEKAKQPSKKRKGTGTVKDKQGARGVQNQGLKLSTGIKFATKLDSFIENLTNHCPHTTLILTNLLTSALRRITLPLHEEHHCVGEGGRGSVVADS